MDKPVETEQEALAEAMVSRRLTIQNQKGLHARAAARFVKLAETFDAEVTVTKGTTTVSGTSIMGLMMLGAATGTALVLGATGREAAAALDALAMLIEDRFGEDQEAPS